MLKPRSIGIFLFSMALAQQSPYGQCGGVTWSGPTTCTPGWTCVPQANNIYYSQCLPSPSSTSSNPAQQTPYGQCGGLNWSGPVQCTSGWTCIPQANNAYYSQCLPASTASAKTPSTSIPGTSSISLMSTSTTTSSNQAQQTPYGQCGGIGWTGPSQCTSGWSCIPQTNNAYYSQCLPASSALPTSAKTTPNNPPVASSTPTVLSSSAPVISPSGTTTTAVSASISPHSCAVSNAPPSSAGKVTFSGINIAGFDFGCGGDGTCSIGSVDPPLGNGKPDGPGQMIHFIKDGFNVFRLPVGWQYLINNMNTASGNLDPTNFGQYDILVQDCLSTGAHCLIDIHNYARFNGAIIGQGGPSNAQFSALWSSLASKYQSQSKVIFGIMNEPHDLNDFPTWAATVQAAVTAIRTTGATNQTILLPGTNYAGASDFLSTSAPALSTITNPDGSTTGLVFDIHKYLDSDGSGTNAECVSNWIQGAFAPVAQYLRCNGRQAFLTETGGGNTQSCVNYLCQTVAYLNQNSDVYLGYIGWAAGSFDVNYVLSETPDSSGNDQLIVSSCLKP